MNFRFAIVVGLLAALIPASVSYSQTILKSDNFEVRFESCLMFLGAIGNTLGLWNEKATWAMVGVMSAAGASGFGAKANDPSRL
jgi:hypothetical protein